MTTSVHAVVRILEVTSCGECPHLDDRWERPPWDCTAGGLQIRNKDKIHRHCPLDTKREYLDANSVIDMTSESGIKPTSANVPVSRVEPDAARRSA
jgi:hypothetical protein